MKSEIEFGKDYIKVRDNVFYLSKPALEILEKWVSLNKDKKAEELENEVVYAAKAFSVLKPESTKEAYNELYTLLTCRYFERKRIENIIEKIYEKCGEKK
ncbi:hypothetical protein [Saccharolobus islandicus]|uniref:hypothetical protein n=1 Tax=Saccharolobus islandicus TaxID=43080 RepID=UPI0003714B07|nr:hypothetical protein [Sulfolobus islandicus]